MTRPRPVGAIALDDLGLRRGRPRRPATAGNAATIGSSCVTSWTLAAVRWAIERDALASVKCGVSTLSYGDRLGSVQFFSPAQRPD